MKKILFLAILLCPAFVTVAQPLDLKTCLEIGLEQNYSVRISRNDEQIASNNATRANAGALPSVSLNAGSALNLDEVRTKSMENEIGFQHGNFDYGANAGVALNWTVFDGFSVRANYDKLKELELMGQINTRISIENFMAGLVAEYFNYIQQIIRLNNLRYAVTLSKERLSIVELRYEFKVASQLDVLQARVDFNADSSSYMQQQESVFSSRIRMNELMSNEDVEARLWVADSVIDVDKRLDFQTLKDEAHRTNALLMRAERNLSVTELNHKIANARNYPYVRFNTGYGYNFNRYNYGVNRNRQTHGLDAGITLGYTIFDGTRRSQIANARIAIDNATLEQRELQLAVNADLSNFWQAYQNNLEILHLETENLVAAKANYEIAMERYKLGDLAGIEMREAQKSLLDAEERLLSARYDTKLCEISLIQLSGGIFTYLE